MTTDWVVIWKIRELFCDVRPRTSVVHTDVHTHDYSSCTVCTVGLGFSLLFAKYCEEYSMSVFLSLLSYLENHTAEVHRIFAHVARGPGLSFCGCVAKWLCSSGLGDDMMFSHNAPCGASCVFRSGEKLLHDSNQMLFHNKQDPTISPCVLVAWWRNGIGRWTRDRECKDSLRDLSLVPVI